MRIGCSKYKHTLQRNAVFIFPHLQLIKIWVSWLTLSAPPLQICIPLHLSYGPAQSEYWFWKWAGNQYVGQFHFWPNWMWSEVVKYWLVLETNDQQFAFIEIIITQVIPACKSGVIIVCAALIVIHIVCNAEAIIARKSKNQFGRSVMGARSAVHISCIEGDSYQK